MRGLDRQWSALYYPVAINKEKTPGVVTLEVA